MPSLIQPPSSNKLSQLPLQQLWELLAPVTACRPLCVFEPENEAQCELVLELARREGKKVRVAGVGHSPSDLACTSEYMLRTEKLDGVLELNREKHYVVAQAGITLNALHAALGQHGLAMKNIGSISDQTLGGVVTTATHGSGIDYPVISMDVLALVLLLADGSRVRCSREENADLFLASICGLGSTGLILEVTLDVAPAFRLKEVQESRPFDEVVRDLDSIAHAAEHVRLWWFPHAGVIRLSSSNRTHEPRKPISTWLWHSLIGYHLIQFLFFLARYVTSLNVWVGRFGAWLVSERTVAVDDSHSIFNVDCKYPQYTTEWAIPYERTQACLTELRAWLDEELASPSGLRPHFPVEIRFSAPDDIWLSPSNGQRTCWIGLIQYKPYGTNVPYRKLFSRFEQIMLRHFGKPHWAKTHPLRPDDLRKIYPRFDDFVRMVERVDPHGIFRNPYVDRHFFGKQGLQYDERVFKKRPLLK
ncbi:L-gulonolactone/D-arabinono-1,4-lactone oxidase [Ganoderma leucocontextum]|nr:L-gulonolactone/D-arabinono-1,4-lactone oxidase [Ganoderma leucocontextum]